MSTSPVVAVVGADGFVGGGLAAGLGARRIVYGPAAAGDVPVAAAGDVLRGSDVVVNAGGFRVRRGLTYADYRRCHAEATQALLPSLREGALLIHVSSAHVLGKSPHRPLGNDATPDPASYPSAEYARAKLEADVLVERAARERGFRAVLLRPTILYARPGDTSLPDNLCKWARRGTMLRLHPRGARHHLCHLDLLVDVARRVVARNGSVPDLSRLVVADPYTVTSRQLDELIAGYLPRPPRAIPIPSGLMSAVLTRTFHSKHPSLDLKTWGDIFGVFQLDTEYDASATYRLLDIDPSQYAPEKTLHPFLREALRA